jgi:hypothetical protein
VKKVAGSHPATLLRNNVLYQEEKEDNKNRGRVTASQEAVQGNRGHSNYLSMLVKQQQPTV